MDSDKVNNEAGEDVPNNKNAERVVRKKTPNDYIFGKLLGEGSFSSVYLAKDVRGPREYAIKVCEKRHIIKEKKTELIQREKEVMNILSNNRSDVAPFFVHLYATFQDSERLYFVMTYASGGELLQLLKSQEKFDLETSQFYAGEVLQALCHLHNLRIVHRDLKPENILLNEKGHIIVTDFGSAKILPVAVPVIETVETPETEEISSNNRRTRKNSFVGTAQYVSPEVLQGKYSTVGPPADLWAFACILYQFLTGSFAFGGTNEYLIFQKILKLSYEFPENFDENAQDLIEKILKLEPQDRLGASDVERYTSIKSHAFFAGLDFDSLHNQIPPCNIAQEDASSNSQFGVGDYEPGFDPRAIAQRILDSDGDQPLEWSRPSPPSPSPPTKLKDDSSNNVEIPLEIPGKSIPDANFTTEKTPTNRCYCC